MSRSAVLISTLAVVGALGCGGRESGSGGSGTSSGISSGTSIGAASTGAGKAGGSVGDMGMNAPPPGSAGASTGSTNLGGCALNSDCISGFVCALGACRAQCQSDVDCSFGGTCVFGVTDGVKTFVCRTPAQANAPCSNPSDCMAPMACASDYRCRDLCTTTADCNVLGVTNMVCAQDANGVDDCASPAEVTVNSMGDQVISAPPPLGAMTGRAVTEPVDASMQSEPAGPEGPPDANVVEVGPPNAGGCSAPPAADTYNDASASGCYQRSIPLLCSGPAADGGTTCAPLCLSSEYALSCYGNNFEPDPLLGCQVITEPTPAGVLYYCCTCSHER